MTRLRAPIVRSLGVTKHLQITPAADGHAVNALPDPSFLEIVDDEGTTLLLRLDSANECIADTWHETIVAAKAQAKFEYDVEGDMWEQMPPASR